MGDGREPPRAQPSSHDSTAGETRTRGTGWLQPITVGDGLFGSARISGWASALLETAPFQRLAGVSLSDVPGPLLFGRPFPSRLDHAIGVYHLARLARPRDRALQAAALAHDLGHGPFSHLSEPLMRDQLGVDHEQRSARLVFTVRDALPAWIRRYLSWLDWDEVASLVQGAGSDGRGALLNGLLDYDNVDNVARFLNASGLGEPGYDPVALARGLTFLSVELPGGAPSSYVTLASAATENARAWQRDRRIVYDYLHNGQRNLALHAMLRKAVDLAAAEGALAPDFLDFTDAEALAHLGALPQIGIATLIAGVLGEALYRRVWEVDLEPARKDLLARLSSRAERLQLEARLAAEAGFADHEVIIEPIVSSAERALPPIIGARQGNLAEPLPPPATRLNVFAAPGAPSDYLHRLQMAASRSFSAHGVRPGPEPVT